MPSFGLTEIVEHIGYLQSSSRLLSVHDVSLERVLCVASFVRNGYRFTPDGQRFESLRPTCVEISWRSIWYVTWGERLRGIGTCVPLNMIFNSLDPASPSIVTAVRSAYRESRSPWSPFSWPFPHDRVELGLEFVADSTVDDWSPTPATKNSRPAIFALESVQRRSSYSGLPSPLWRSMTWPNQWSLPLLRFHEPGYWARSAPYRSDWLEDRAPGSSRRTNGFQSAATRASVPRCHRRLQNLRHRRT